MSIEIRWADDARTLIRSHFHLGWTWEDFDEAAVMQENMLNSVSYPVYTIATYETTALPKGALSRLQQIAREHPAYVHPNAALLVNVVQSGMVKAVATIFNNLKLAGGKMVIANSEEEALERVEQHRQAAG